MTEDVFGKLKGLCDDVRARIEATADWKTLTALERAAADVKSLLPDSAPIQPESDQAPSDDVAAVDEDDSVSTEPAETDTVETVAAASADDSAEAAAETAPENVVDESASDGAADASDNPANAEVSADAEDEAVASDDAPSTEVPADDAALMSDLVGSTIPTTSTPPEATLQ